MTTIENTVRWTNPQVIPCTWTAVHQQIFGCWICRSDHGHRGAMIVDDMGDLVELGFQGLAVFVHSSEH